MVIGISAAIATAVRSAASRKGWNKRREAAVDGGPGGVRCPDAHPVSPGVSTPGFPFCATRTEFQDFWNLQRRNRRRDWVLSHTSLPP
jgi:hypothetical protein